MSRFEHITEASRSSSNKGEQSPQAQHLSHAEEILQLQDYHKECQQRTAQLKKYVETELTEPATSLSFVEELSQHCETFFNKPLADKTHPEQLNAFQQGCIAILKKLKALADAHNNFLFAEELIQAAKYISRQYEPLKDDQPRDLLEAACYLAALEEFREIMGNTRKINDAIVSRQSFLSSPKDKNLPKQENNKTFPPLEAPNPQHPFGARAASVPYEIEPRVIEATSQHPALKNLPPRAAVIVDAAMVTAGETTYRRFLHQRTKGMSENEADEANAARLKDIRGNLTGCLFAPLKLELDATANKPTLTTASQEQLNKKITGLKKYIVRQQYEIAQLEHAPGGAEDINNTINTLVQLYEEKILTISKIQITGDNLPEVFEALLPADPNSLTALKEKLAPLASLNDRGQEGYVLTAFCNAVNAKLQDLSSTSSAKSVSPNNTEEREKTLRKIAPLVEELKNQNAIQPVLDALDKCDLTKLRLVAYFKDQKLYAPMSKDKYLLLTGKSAAMMEWLGYPIPEGRGQKVLFALSFLLPHRLIKLIGGGAAYWCGVVHERGLRSDEIGYLPWAICTGFYLLLRAVFLPVKSWQAAANYSKKWYVRYPLIFLSGLTTIASWSVASAFALPAMLPFIIQGLGLISSSAATAVYSFFTSAASYLGSWLGVGATQVASAAVGAGIVLAITALRVNGLLLQSFGNWLGPKLTSFGQWLRLSWKKAMLENKTTTAPSASKQAVEPENSTHSSPDPIKEEQQSAPSSQPISTTENVLVPAAPLTSSSSSMPEPYVRVEAALEDGEPMPAPYSSVVVLDDEEPTPAPYSAVVVEENAEPVVQKDEMRALLKAVLMGNSQKQKNTADTSGDSRKVTPSSTPEPSPRVSRQHEARLPASDLLSTTKASFFFAESQPAKHPATPLTVAKLAAHKTETQQLQQVNPQEKPASLSA
jgi:hypothetical protein